VQASNDSSYALRLVVAAQQQLAAASTSAQ